MEGAEIFFLELQRLNAEKDLNIQTLTIIVKSARIFFTLMIYALNSTERLHCQKEVSKMFEEDFFLQLMDVVHS